MELQAQRCLFQIRTCHTDLERYVYLQSLKDRNETLFYFVLISNLKELLPIVYTPTVGEACLKFGALWRTTSGMYFSREDKGYFREIVNNWKNDVDIIVVTDGSRILGLGDLGANGMGIPLGKISLYVAAGGFHPDKSLPALLDVGTNNPKLLDDPFYLGTAQKRLEPEQYYALLDEFLMAVKDRWPNCLVQFEDFSNDHCFDILTKYRHKMLCFNDDIQGTGAVISAGFLNASKIVGSRLRDQKIVFLGAGSASVGVADLIVKIISLTENISVEEARKQCWMIDSSGLLTTTRGGQLQDFKKNYARSDAPFEMKTLIDVIKEVKPTCLIGLCGQAKAFDEAALRELTKHCEKPIVFALSNPTSKAECTAEEAYKFTDGKCVFASGSPFDPVEYKGKTYYPGQGNNMYIFPGLGFGAILAKSKEVTDLMIVRAAKTLADITPKESLEGGKIYPEIGDIRNISAQVAAAVIQCAFEENVAKLSEKPSDLVNWVKSKMYFPKYENYNVNSSL